MKILHIADLHLGAKNSKLPKEKQDVLRDEMLENCYKLFNEQGAKFDVCLICGDLFHSKSVSMKIIENFFACVRAFGKPVIYVNGNHDEKLILSTLPENFVVLDEGKTSFETQDFVFCNAEHSQDIDLNKNNVLLLHGNIESAKDNDYVDITHFLNKGFAYIALGHVHKVKKYKKGDNIFAYSGSLFSNGFDECGDKGYIDVEINNNKVEKCEFKLLPQRNYIICEYDISKDNSNREIAEGIKKEIKNQGKSERDIVRVILKGYYEESLNKSIPLLSEALQDFFYIEFVDNSKLKIDVTKLKSETLSLKNEFISLVENAQIDGSLRQKIINIGIEALKGDDFSL
ncbi:MAG: metallophosphoesterase family protein [Clostridia bacterium]|nr:metallophosphoesterase family protein [Clostridia bacterium]MBQ8792489.1 metallophosphoesterase family protein [Clostridia bacterium]